MDNTSQDIEHFLLATDLFFYNLIKEGIICNDQLIPTNSTITSIDKHYVVTNYDGEEIQCAKKGTVRCRKNAPKPGQRAYYYLRGNKRVSYCVILEMTYGELIKIFRKTVQFSQTASETRKGQALIILTFLTKIAADRSDVRLEIGVFKAEAKAFFKRQSHLHPENFRITAHEDLNDENQLV